MEVAEYLKNHQQIIYKTLANASLNQNFSHAYLLSGNPGMPLFEVAMFLAKSILCDSPNPLACDSCLTCARVENGNYADILIFDGLKSTIKKENVTTLLNTFQKTALEEKGIMVYVIHIVESMKSVTVNALLKFLEEPKSKIFAILTTENESKILPTIISRSQVLRFKEIDKDLIKKEAQDLGVSIEDASILSDVCGSSKEMQTIAEEETYQVLKFAVMDFLRTLNVDNERARFYLQSECSNIINTQQKAKLFLSILSYFFNEIVKAKYENISNNTELNDIIKSLASNLKHVEHDLRVVLDAKNKLNFNVNSALVLDHIMHEIDREDIC